MYNIKIDGTCVEIEYIIKMDEYLLTRAMRKCYK